MATEGRKKKPLWFLKKLFSRAKRGKTAPEGPGAAPEEKMADRLRNLTEDASAGKTLNPGDKNLLASYKAFLNANSRGTNSRGTNSRGTNSRGTNSRGTNSRGTNLKNWEKNLLGLDLNKVKTGLSISKENFKNLNTLVGNMEFAGKRLQHQKNRLMRHVKPAYKNRLAEQLGPYGKFVEELAQRARPDALRLKTKATVPNTVFQRNKSTGKLRLHDRYRAKIDQFERNFKNWDRFLPSPTNYTQELESPFDLPKGRIVRLRKLMGDVSAGKPLSQGDKNLLAFFKAHALNASTKRSHLMNWEKNLLGLDLNKVKTREGSGDWWQLLKRKRAIPDDELRNLFAEITRVRRTPQKNLKDWERDLLQKAWGLNQPTLEKWRRYERGGNLALQDLAALKADLNLVRRKPESERSKWNEGRLALSDKLTSNISDAAMRNELLSLMQKPKLTSGELTRLKFLEKYGLKNWEAKALSNLRNEQSRAQNKILLNKLFSEGPMPEPSVWQNHTAERKPRRKTKTLTIGEQFVIRPNKSYNWRTIRHPSE